MAFRNPLARLIRTITGAGNPGVDIGTPPPRWASLGAGINPDGSAAVTIYDSDPNNIGKWVALTVWARSLLVAFSDASGPGTAPEIRLTLQDDSALNTSHTLLGRASGNNTLGVTAAGWDAVNSLQIEAALQADANGAYVRVDRLLPRGGTATPTVYLGSTGDRIIVDPGATITGLPDQREKFAAGVRAFTGAAPPAGTVKMREEGSAVIGIDASGNCAFNFATVFPNGVVSVTVTAGDIIGITQFECIQNISGGSFVWVKCYYPNGTRPTGGTIRINYTATGW